MHLDARQVVPVVNLFFFILLKLQKNPVLQEKEIFWMNEKEQKENGETKKWMNGHWVGLWMNCNVHKIVFNLQCQVQLCLCNHQICPIIWEWWLWRKRININKNDHLFITEKYKISCYKSFVLLKCLTKNYYQNQIFITSNNIWFRSVLIA